MCGIFGILNIVNKENIINELIDGMKKLQHRGKDSYGISSLDNNYENKINKYMGLIKGGPENDVDILSCIGHIKYSTSGKSLNNQLDIEEVQPIKKNDIIIVHNGNIPCICSFDTEYILRNIVNYDGTIEEGIINTIQRIPASYSIIIQNRDKLYILKDRYGIRPLCYGYKGGNIYISSETVGLDGCTGITEVLSGEVLKISKDGVEQIYRHPKTFDSICSFELIYFMDPLSKYKKYSVKFLREELAYKLYQREKKIKKGGDFIVVGVPKSGIIYGEKYAQYLSLEYKQLIKKKDTERTFITNNTEKISELCDRKFLFDSEGIKGKKVIVVDDTIVRGNVIKSIIRKLKVLNAKEIHIRIPSPPVIDICQLGIAITKKEELIMNTINDNDICKFLAVNSLEYLTLDDLNIFPKNSYKQCFGGGIPSEILSLNT